MGKVELTLEEYNAILEQIRSMDPISSLINEGRFVAANPKPKPKKRKKSAWQKYMGQKKNQIKYKSGPKKGRLDLKRMSRQFKKSRK